MKESRLEKGMLSPDFKAETFAGEDLTLTQFKGKKVWLSFYRYASCPLCNLRINHIIKQYEIFSKEDLKIVAVFQSSKESVGEYVAQQKPPFDLITDPSEKLYKLYKLEHSVMAMLHPDNMLNAGKAMALGFLPGKPEGTVSRIPADFLIDENGIIQNAFYGNNIGDHIPFEEVYEFMRVKK